MTAHQKLIRDAQRTSHAVPADFSKARVYEIPYAEAKELILKYEWLGTMGATERAFGLFFDSELAGVECFGRTAGTKVAISVCGPEHAHRVKTLNRGACVSWAHPHSASFLINAACELMAKEGYNIFVAYSDPAAGEIGTVYQASNWLYCGTTKSTEKFRTPSGEIRDARLVSAYSRDRTHGILTYTRTRAKQKALLIEAGCQFFKDNVAKHRYVGLYGDARIKRLLRKALQWRVSPYPKRKGETD